MKVLVINGANLNMLGAREPEIYGKQTLAEIRKEFTEYAEKMKVESEFFTSNSEGEIIDKIHSFYGDGLIINAGAYTHYSYAIRDALKILECPKVEVHISNVYQREEFRHKSVISPVCDGVIAGLGSHGYILALDYITRKKR